MSDELSPTARHLKGRVAHYRTLAAREQNQAKAADYLDRARTLEMAIAPAPLTPAARADIELAERLVREGEKEVAARLALVEKLDAGGDHRQSRNARELLAALRAGLRAARRNLQIIRGARKRQG